MDSSNVTTKENFVRYLLRTGCRISGSAKIDVMTKRHQQARSSFFHSSFMHLAEGKKVFQKCQAEMTTHSGTPFYIIILWLSTFLVSLSFFQWLKVSYRCRIGKVSDTFFSIKYNRKISVYFEKLCHIQILRKVSVSYRILFKGIFQVTASFLTVESMNKRWMAGQMKEEKCQ